MEEKPASAPTLAEALARHAIAIPPEQLERLDAYCRLLWQWNEKLNLTRHTDYQTFVDRDVIDALQLGKLLHAGESVLDVGSGGGAPGIPLAILRPDVKISLCESVAKKTRALESMVTDLGLKTPVYHGRAEAVLAARSFDAAMARAVGPLEKLLQWFQPHWQSIGRLLLVKGPNWIAERKIARERGLLRNLELRRAAAYPMPGTESESVILVLWPKGGKTPLGGEGE